ncbi:MAG: hypothetical protein IJT90_01615 [Bacteroidaceae bacterium]|nr:hypothetical protein [Bacteroidaceae bacterium]
MKKKYIAPECEAYTLHAILPLAASQENVALSNEYSDEGGFSKQWSGSIFDDEKPFEQ